MPLLSAPPVSRGAELSGDALAGGAGSAGILTQWPRCRPYHDWSDLSRQPAHASQLSLSISGLMAGSSAEARMAGLAGAGAGSAMPGHPIAVSGRGASALA